MIHALKRVGILFGIFAAALVIYIFVNRSQGQARRVIYTAMEESALPVLYVDMYGRRMNPMFGYRQDMGNAPVRDSLTILPQDRVLGIKVSRCDVPVLGIRYEIRSLDLQRLVEDTVVESWEEEEDGLSVQLPIQNLLAQDREYLLRIELDTEKYGAVYYYTRIVWTEDGTAQSMIDLAVGFSAKTFSYEQARDLVTYLETNDTEDNSTFGRTTIRSSFAQLTWGKLKMQPASEVQVTLKEKDGIMGCVSLSYVASCSNDDGEKEYYEVEENFTLKWNAVRTYLMNYERTVNQIVSGDRRDFSGKRIMLGITNENEVSVVRSADGEVLAYRANHDLWSYQQKERRAVRVFSFRGGDIEDLREHHRDHGIKILHVEDSGDVDFLVYGYQNRGKHEGEFGIVGYHYDDSANGLRERFFIPAYCRFEELEGDLGRLSYYAQDEMLYLFLDHAIYGIDLKSNENMVVADALGDGSYAISPDQSRIAWQEGGQGYGSHLIHLMDLESGEKLEIRGRSEREFVRALGFVGKDLVYGIASEDALWVQNGRAVDLPMYVVEIMNEQMQVETRYEKPGYYVADVDVDESRIHLSRVTRTSGQEYIQAQEDTIVCNMDMGPGRLDGIGWYASQEKGKLFFVQLDQDIRSGRSVRVLSPRRLGTEESDRLELTSICQLEGMFFYAYGAGRLLGVTTDFTSALQLSYGHMGFVTDQNQRILWDRVNRVSTASVQDLGAAYAQMERCLDGFAASKSFSDGLVLLDARGCTMMQLLYFLGQGMPVIGYTGEGEYLVLSGFDQYNVTVYNPLTGESFKAGLNDSTEYFRLRGNDFVCAVQVQ